MLVSNTYFWNVSAVSTLQWLHWTGVSKCVQHTQVHLAICTQRAE